MDEIENQWNEEIHFYDELMAFIYEYTDLHNMSLIEIIGALELAKDVHLRMLQDEDDTKNPPNFNGFNLN